MFVNGLGTGGIVDRSYSNKSISNSAERDNTYQASASTVVERRETSGHEWVNSIYKIKDGYSLQAKYSNKSTDDNPIMYVELKDENGKLTSFEIEVNKIDPKNASRAEIFALTTHKYSGDGESLFKATIGYSYHEGISSFNNLDGYGQLSADISKSVLEDRLDFISLYKQISNILFQSRDMRAYGRVQDMLSVFATQR